MFHRTKRRNAELSKNQQGDQRQSALPRGQADEPSCSVFDYNTRDLLDKVTNTETGGTPKITAFTCTPRGQIDIETVVLQSHNVD